MTGLEKMRKKKPQRSSGKPEKRQIRSGSREKNSPGQR